MPVVFYHSVIHGLGFFICYIKFLIVSETFTSHISKNKVYELFSGFSEIKMSLKIDVLTSFTGLLQVVKIINMADRFSDPPY